MLENKRIFKTKRDIENSFITLLEEKNFNSITVKDICNASLTSRSTFYSHYMDKYDLLKKIVDRYSEIIKRTVQKRFIEMEQGNIKDFLYFMAESISTYKYNLKILLKVHITNGDLRAEIEKILFTQCHSFLEEKYESNIYSIELLTDIYVANAFVLMTWSLEHGVDKQAVILANNVQHYLFKQLLSK